MSDLKFLQIHSLHGYSAALLNRDDSGLAKRMSYGGCIRTRISSQCLKRHWRVVDDAHALQNIDGAQAAVRSREIVTREIINALKEKEYDSEVVDAVGEEFQKAVYGDKGGKKSGRQPLLLGVPEIEYLRKEAEKIITEHGSDVKQVKKAAQEWGKKKDVKANMKALHKENKLPGGLVAALFGRMVTSDIAANIDAAIHVAHAFTVHEEESESDFFAVVDDILEKEGDSGAAHLDETELTSGLFYGYVVVDRNTLLRNLGGDQKMAGQVVQRLVHLIATVSPGAKLGSTAPYDYASWMLVEAGERQPRSLAEAFRTPCDPAVEQAEQAVCSHIQKIDDAYGVEEARRVMNLTGNDIPGADRLALPELATWAGGVIENGAT